MGARGPAPSADPSKLRGHRKPEPWTDLSKPQKKKVRALPNARQYTKATQAWWKTWASSPQSAQFLETDWQRLAMVADLVDDFYCSTEPRERKMLLDQITKEEKRFGATPDDRLRLRWRFVENDEAEERAERPRARARGARRDPRLRAIDGGRQ